MTLETALSAPRLRRHELVPIFRCNNSIAILHTDWFHGASDFSHYRRHEHYLEHRRSLPVIRLLVMRMSRKHNALMGTVDRRGYGSQQIGTICDTRGPYPTIWRPQTPFFRQIRLIRCAYESLRHLHLEIWRFLC